MSSTDQTKLAVTFTFTASEATAGSADAFGAGDLTMENCLSSGSAATPSETTAGEVYTVVCDVAASGVVDVKGSVAASAFEDLAGNKNVASDVFIVTQDVAAPVVTITAVDSDGKTLSSDATSPFDLGSYSKAERITFTLSLIHI